VEAELYHKDGQTDMKLPVAVRNFAHAPNGRRYTQYTGRTYTQYDTVRSTKQYGFTPRLMQL
jgi:hypothetical protein